MSGVRPLWWIVWGVALYALVGYALAYASDEDSAPDPIEGVVRLLSIIKDDLFVYLDTDDDGQGDVWVKLGPETLYTNQEDEVDDLDNINVGTRLVLLQYELEEAFIEAYVVAELPPVPEGSANGDDDDDDDNQGPGGGDDDDDDDDDDNQGSQNQRQGPSNDDDDNSGPGGNDDDDNDDNDNDDDDDNKG